MCPSEAIYINDQAELQQFLNRQKQNPWPEYDGYKKLDRLQKTIRILAIWFRPGTRELHGRLDQADLSCSPRYEALSYYWGPPDEQGPIVIDGETVLIAKNLHNLLARLCSSGQVLPIWVDALCINQADDEERNWQVAMMGDIYRSAIRVKAWLGDADADSNFALDCVKYMSPDPSRMVASFQMLEKRARQAFHSLISRPYWQRMWIIQEIGLACELMLMSGSRIVQWDEFLAVTREFLGDLRPIGEKPASDMNLENIEQSGIQREHLAVVERLDAVRRIGQRSSLIAMAARFVNHACTDPRDKIYALLGIAEQTTSHSMPVSYSKSILEVYLDLLCYTISTGAASDAENETGSTDEFDNDAMRLLRGLDATMQKSDSLPCEPLLGKSWRLPCYSMEIGKQSWLPWKSPGRGTFPVKLWLNSFSEGTECCLPTTLVAPINEGDRVLWNRFIPSLVLRSEQNNQRHEMLGCVTHRSTALLSEYHKSLNSKAYGAEVCKYPDLSPTGSISKIYLHVSPAFILWNLLLCWKMGPMTEDRMFIIRWRRLVFAMRQAAESGPLLCNCKHTFPEASSEPPAYSLICFLGRDQVLQEERFRQFFEA